MITRRKRMLGMAAVGVGIRPWAGWTKDFPTRPVTLIVLIPGTSGDVCLRALAAATERHLGQSIVIENRPGAGSTLGPAQMAASANPDGYTLSQIGQTVFRLPFLRRTTYDPAKDFTYIITVSAYTFGVVVKNDTPWQTTDSFHQVGIYTGSILNRARPGDLPVVQSTRLEFIINLQTATALGIEVAPQLLAITDEVIH
jgi:tripartite-type tricarboxylate transporter receptor subunit TctC